MNYYGTRGGHDLVFHTELRDALFASGLPFIVSVNDVPEARELYSGADSITSLRSGEEQFQARAARDAPGHSCCQRRIGGSNPVAAAGLTRQSCCHARIVKGNPVATPGLTAGRVSGEKTLCQRYCEDSIAGRPSVLARAWQAAGYAGQARPGYAGQLGPRSHSQKKSVLQSSPHGRTGIFVTLVPPMSRKRGWASPFWASPYSLGEPSNEVGASHQTRLGRAIKRGWASQY